MNGGSREERRLPGGLRTDLYVRLFRIGFLPQVITPTIRSQTSRRLWLRRTYVFFALLLMPATEHISNLLRFLIECPDRKFR